MFGTAGIPLHRSHDVAMLDLDGVVYHGARAIPGVAQALGAAREYGLVLKFITNNASRSTADVAATLTTLGIEATPDDVVTSAQAAARLLLDRYGAGARVVVLGADGLRQAVEAVGLVPMTPPEGAEPLTAEALVTGFGPDVRWSQVIRMAVAIRDGLPWVAANTDLSFPTEYGIAPGHGTLVRMLAEFTGVTPEVAGKPEPPLLEETIRRSGAECPLMVGDRLDTDIEGARRLGIDSLLVLTGVTGLGELVTARPEQRPTFLAPTLESLVRPMTGVEVSADTGNARTGGWRTEVVSGVLRVLASGPAESAAPEADPVGDWWRAVAAASWWHLDSTGAPVEVHELRVPR